MPCVVDGLFAVVEPDRRVALARQAPLAPAEGVQRADRRDGENQRRLLVQHRPCGDRPDPRHPAQHRRHAGAVQEPADDELPHRAGGGQDGRAARADRRRSSVCWAEACCSARLARQLVGLRPVIGLVPKVAVAYGGTWAIGKAVGRLGDGGRRLTPPGSQSSRARGSPAAAKWRRRFRRGIGTLTASSLAARLLAPSRRLSRARGAGLPPDGREPRAGNRLRSGSSSCTSSRGPRPASSRRRPRRSRCRASTSSEYSLAFAGSCL